MFNFTQTQFNTLKFKDKNYKKNEQALLKYFINEAKKIKEWCPVQLMVDSFAWLYQVLTFMRDNRKDKSSKLNNWLKKLPGTPKIGEIIVLYQQMTGGYGTTYVETLKKNVVNAIDTIKGILHTKKINLNHALDNQTTIKIYDTTTPDVQSGQKEVPTNFFASCAGQSQESLTSCTLRRSLIKSPITVKQESSARQKTSGQMPNKKRLKINS